MDFEIMFSYRKTLLVLLASFIFLLMGPFYIVHPGEVAIHKRFGSIINTPRDGGIYFMIPGIDTIVYMNRRINKVVIETNSLSKDLQFVSIGVAVNYQVEDALSLYREVGSDYEKVIIDPLAQESIKAIVACYTAEELIQHRHEAKERVLKDVSERLVPRYIRLIDFNFVHLDFHKAFMDSVEQKQIAQQSAMTAHNLTKRIEEEMIQKKLKIDVAVYELKSLREQTTPLMIELKKIEKWDGRMPMYMGGSTPLISLGEK